MSFSVSRGFSSQDTSACRHSFRPILVRSFTTLLVHRFVELMAPTTLEFDGLTSFRSRPKSSFRFILTMKGNKLNVWLENRKSKKQW